jgi:uroporphyrinogen-III synthase
LLDVLPARQANQHGSVFIVAAPGGRAKLADELQARGYSTHMLMVYERRPASLAPAALEEIRQADRILSVWTSANAMQSLAQRMPAAGWLRICRGEWLVISERLARLAQAFSPAAIHRAAGPSNAELVTAVQKLV